MQFDTLLKYRLDFALKIWIHLHDTIADTIALRPSTDADAISSFRGMSSIHIAGMVLMSFVKIWR